jgi:hypothetical protein
LNGPFNFCHPSPGGVCMHHTWLFSLLFHKYHGAGAAIMLNETNNPIIKNIAFFIIDLAIFTCFWLSLDR